MSFRDWLYSELVDDGIIDNDYEDDFTIEQLYAETELTEDMYEQYKSEFEDYCESIDQEPDWDVNYR